MLAIFYKFFIKRNFYLFHIYILILNIVSSVATFYFLKRANSSPKIARKSAILNQKQPNAPVLCIAFENLDRSRPDFSSISLLQFIPQCFNSQKKVNSFFIDQNTMVYFIQSFGPAFFKKSYIFSLCAYFAEERVQVLFA